MDQRAAHDPSSTLPTNFSLSLGEGRGEGKQPRRGAFCFNQGYNPWRARLRGEFFYFPHPIRQMPPLLVKPLLGS